MRYYIMPESLVLSDESERRLRPTSVERSQFITKTALGPTTSQAVDIGLLQGMIDKNRQQQMFTQEQKKLELRKKQIQQQNKESKRQLMRQIWGPGLGDVMGGLKD